jgi:hypothetical protein
VVIYLILAFVTMFAEHIAERREARGPTDSGASAAASAQSRRSEGAWQVARRPGARAQPTF